MDITFRQKVCVIMWEPQFGEMCRYKMPFYEQFIYLFITIYFFSCSFFFHFLLVSYFLLCIRLSFLPLFFLVYSRLCLFKTFIIASSHLSILHTFHSSGELIRRTMLNTTYEQRTINARLFSVMPVLFSFSALKFRIIRENFDAILTVHLR